MAEEQAAAVGAAVSGQHCTGSAAGCTAVGIAEEWQEQVAGRQSGKTAVEERLSGRVAAEGHLSGKAVVEERQSGMAAAGEQAGQGSR